MRRPDLQVRERLTLAAVIPLIVVVLTGVPLLAAQLGSFREAGSAAREASTGALVGPVVSGLQDEVLLSLAYLAAPSARPGPLLEQRAVVADRIGSLQRGLGAEMPAAVAGAGVLTGGLDGLRAAVTAREVASQQVVWTFEDAVQELIATAGLESSATEATAAPALIRWARQNGVMEAAVLEAVVAPPSSGSAASRAADARAVAAVHRQSVTARATSAQVLALGVVDTGTTGQRVDALIGGLRADPARFVEPGSPSAAQLLGTLRAHATLRALTQEQLSAGISRSATDSAQQAGTVASLVGMVLVLAVALIIGAAVVIGRSVARPLRRLAVAADRVAELARAELVRVSDADSPSDAPPTLAAVDMHAPDELGAVAASFNRVQAVAALLLERQVAIQRNAAVMFDHVGRRTRGIVARQLGMIDVLEHDEQDPDRLDRLYRLDHLTSRLRRYATSLMVLSGSSAAELDATPETLSTLVRSAVGDVEGYQRVSVRPLTDIVVRAGAAADVALLIAELLDNATSFSPPETEVLVTSSVTRHGCEIAITDHGIGMSEEQLATENERLVHRERLEIAPTGALGLFVVGRVARRHGVAVALRPTVGGGLTATVEIPARLIQGAGWPVGQPEVAEDAPTTRPLPRVAPAPPVGTEQFSPVGAAASDNRYAGRHAGGNGGWNGNGGGGTEEAGSPGVGLQRRIRGSSRQRNGGSLGRHRLELQDSPDTARESLDQFDEGERRAAEDLPGAGIRSLAAPPMRAPQPPLPQAEPAGPARPEPAQRDSAQLESARLESGRFDTAPPAPPPPPGAEGLNRRVRGARIPSGGRSGGARLDLQAQARADADAVRLFVDDIEAGITRAIGDIYATPANPPDAAPDAIADTAGDSAGGAYTTGAVQTTEGRHP